MRNKRIKELEEGTGKLQQKIEMVREKKKNPRQSALTSPVVSRSGAHAQLSLPSAPASIFQCDEFSLFLMHVYVCAHILVCIVCACLLICQCVWMMPGDKVRGHLPEHVWSSSFLSWAWYSQRRLKPAAAQGSPSLYHPWLGFQALTAVPNIFRWVLGIKLRVSC